MTVIASLVVFKLVVIVGLALWATLGVVNNIAAFRAEVAAVGRMMAMQLLDQEPAIKTPLQARRVHGPGWHWLGYVAVLVIQAATGLLLWYAALGFAGVLAGTVDGADAVVRANLALAAFAVLAFFLTLGGQWFAYFIRQETLHIIHLVLIAIAILGVVVVNLPA